MWFILVIVLLVVALLFLVEGITRKKQEFEKAKQEKEKEKARSVQRIALNQTEYIER